MASQPSATSSAVAAASARLRAPPRASSQRPTPARTTALPRSRSSTIAVLAAIVLERDLGSAVVLAGVGLWLLALGGARKRALAAATALLAGLGWLAIHAEAYRSARLRSFSDPFSDPLNTGFQPVHAMYAMGSGGLHGVGLGNSVEKYQWLPEAQSDFIFAIIGEELGIIGTMSVILAFGFLLWRGVRVAMRAPDRFGTLLAGGITAWIGIQAFVNMAAV